MISFSNINKQYGKQLLFVDASFQLNPGEKVGLVGPNGGRVAQAFDLPGITNKLGGGWLPRGAEAPLFHVTAGIYRSAGSAAPPKI